MEWRLEIWIHKQNIQIQAFKNQRVKVKILHWGTYICFDIYLDFYLACQYWVGFVLFFFNGIQVKITELKKKSLEKHKLWHDFILPWLQ